MEDTPPSSKLDVSHLYSLLQSPPRYAIAEDATKVFTLPNGADLWASIGGKSRTYQKDVVVSAPKPVQLTVTSTGRPKPQLKTTATSSTSTVGIRDEYEQEKSVIATIVNNGIGMVVSLMNNVIAPVTGEAKSTFESHGSIQHDELDENLGSFAPPWFSHDTFDTAVYNFAQGTANFGGGFASGLLPLNENGDVYEFWLNPSTLLRKVRFFSPNGQADVVHVLFRSWQDNGIPINLMQSIKLNSKQRGDPDAYSDLMQMLKAVYTIQGYYTSPSATLQWQMPYNQPIDNAGLVTTETFAYDLQQAPNVRNMLVHCAAGIGRTGTFLTLYRYLWPVDPASISIVEIINEMRLKRKKRMVYTPEQLGFIVHVLNDVHRNKHDSLSLLYPDESTREVFLKRDTPEGRYGPLAYLVTGASSPSRSPTTRHSSYASPQTKRSRATTMLSPRVFQSPVASSSLAGAVNTPMVESVSAAVSKLYTTTPTAYGTPPRYR